MTTPGIATASTGQIFKPQTTQLAAYNLEINKTTGLWSPIGETQVVPTSTPHIANKQTIYVQDYADSINVSKDLFDDNQFANWSTNIAAFARKAKITQDQQAFKAYNNAFTTTLTADGVSWINAAHPLIGGGTTSNYLGTLALSSTNLNTGIVALRTQVDQAGTILGGVPSTLLVPPALYKTAIEVTESALVSDSNTNALNIYRSAYGILVWTTPYIAAVAGGSDTAWFLLTPDHSMTRLVRQGIETALRPWQYSNNRSYLYQGNFREVVYVPDYSGAVAST